MAWAPVYASVAELKAFRGIVDAVDDTEVALAVEAASRAVDQHCLRQFGLVSAAEARDFTARWDPDLGWWARIDDLMTVTGWLVDLDLDGDGTYGTSVATSGLALWPFNAGAEGRPWREIRWLKGSTLPVGRDGAVRVTGQWGWSTVPDAVKLATLLQASRLLSRRHSPFGVAGSPELGNELRLLARVDPDVAVHLRPFVRHPIGVG